MKLPARLMSIVQFIPAGSTVADIGTDHALLPVYLVREGLAAGVVAGDLHPGPLAAARKNVSDAGLTGQISLRQGFGLEIIGPGEAESAVIAGMGGSTIRQILENVGPQAFLLKQLVLQPAAGAGLLREWLADHGWRIAGEDLVKDGGRFYETILAVPGREETRDPVLLSIGPRLYAMKHPLLSELLTLEIRKCRQIITALRKSTGGKAAAKKTELQERIKKLELIIKCLSNAKP